MGPIEISGRYRLERLMGEGGMGAVYRAENIAVGRPVAVKLVHAMHAQNPMIVGRLMQEARATATIESEHVVQVLDAGEDARFGLFLVMELLAGEDLERRLSREKRLATEEAIRIADQTARGLGHAHARGIIHRDLKPANVFLCAREEGPSLVKIVDFGIAKLVRDSSAASRSRELTSAGCVVGTPQYMSPEQAQGLASTDARTDVYALGALVYEMLVGEPPVPNLGSYEAKILHIVTQPRPRLRDALPHVDPELDQLVADMLASDPDDRPRDMRAVRERFARLGPAAPRTAISAPPPRIRRLSRRTAWHLGWCAAAVLGVAIGIVTVTVTSRTRASSPPPHAAVVPRPTRLAPSRLETMAVARRAAPVAPGVTALAVPTVTISVAMSAAPPPAPRPSSAPAGSISVVPRPFGGTGISQEF